MFSLSFFGILCEFYVKTEFKKDCKTFRLTLIPKNKFVVHSYTFEENWEYSLKNEPKNKMNFFAVKI